MLRACGSSPHCDPDGSILHLHQLGQLARHGPLQDPGAVTGNNYIMGLTGGIHDNTVTVITVQLYMNNAK